MTKTPDTKTEMVNETDVAQSPDSAEQKKQALEQLIPEAFSEGRLDIEALKRTLGENVTIDGGERYRLDWAGKSQAYKVLQTPTTATLRPQRDKSINFDTAQHVFIEGENLEVLKVLQKAYFGKVKLIYIDPPYNTGNDSFIYPDRFQESKEDYLKRINELEDDGTLMREGFFRKNSRENGHYHSNWLNMMLPRLYIARNLLREDGVIFVSCDDHEVHNLRCLMNEVFGEDNFVACCVWQKRYSRENRGAIGDAHEYLLVYGREPYKFQEVRGLVQPNEKQLAIYRNPNNDPKGRWRAVPMTAQGFRPNQMYEITSPSGKIHEPPEGRCWSMTEPEYKRLLDEGRIYFGKDGDSQPNVIRYLSEMEGLVPWTWWPAKEVGHTDESRKEIRAIFGTQTVFDTPKPVRLLRRVLEIATPSPADPEICMDFFAGSGATMEAVLRQNLDDGGKRRCINVQLPEPVELEQSELDDIADVARYRVKKAIESMQADADLATQVPNDLGFKSFGLAPSNFKQWRGDGIKSAEELAEQMQIFIKTEKGGADTEDILYELLLKFGQELTTPVETLDVEGETVFAIRDKEMLFVLAGFNEAMIDAIAALKPQEVVALDSAFQDSDELKTNFDLRCRDAGIRLTCI